MKKIITLFALTLLCLCSAAYGRNTAPPATETIALVGPWHLDSERNDHAALADRFPGYAEWSASMEICSDGRMGWYIGAEGWHGSYVREGGVLRAQTQSVIEPLTRTWTLGIVTENGLPMLEMYDRGMTIRWVYGDQEDPADGHDRN